MTKLYGHLPSAKTIKSDKAWPKISDLVKQKFEGSKEILNVLEEERKKKDTDEFTEAEKKELIYKRASVEVRSLRHR